MRPSDPTATDRGAFDRATLEAAQRGDSTACRALVVHHQRAVFALVSRMAGPGRRSEVEDLAQETFLRVFRALPRFDPDGTAKLSTWILTIATRLCIDAYRKRGGVVESLDDHRESLTEPERVDAVVEGRELGRRIAEAAGALSPEVRAAFVLRAYHDLDYRDIAETLGCELGTAKSRVSRARARLAEALREGDESEEGERHG